MANQPKKESNKLIIIALLSAVIIVLFILYYRIFLGTGERGARPSGGSNDIALIITIIAVLAALGMAVYFIIASKMNKNRCPKCKMRDDYIVVREKELSHDAQMVTKPIQKKIRDANGQILKTTKEIGHVTVVKSVLHQQRKCKNCYHMWDVTIHKKIEY